MKQHTSCWVTVLAALLSAYVLPKAADAEEAFQVMVKTVGFVTVEKQLYERVQRAGRDDVLEVWYHDPVSGQQRPKTESGSGTYFSLQWHGATYMIVRGSRRPTVPSTSMMKTANVRP
jgi:hypothetical protein